MRSVELFAGAGGLALGSHAAGFQHEVVVERDADTCSTIRANQQRGLEPLTHWRLFDDDIRKFDYTDLPRGIDFISGGPPCQPFSMGGKHRAYLDERDMFPEAVRAVRELQPKAFLFENVKGLTRENFAPYFNYIQLQLTYPDLSARLGEVWLEHLARLEQHHTKGTDKGLSYRVVYRLVNAADYGVPQRRERVFIVGFRCDIHQAWSFPKPTHSQDDLLWSQWVSCEYWQKHGIARKDIPIPTEKTQEKVNRLYANDKIRECEPWLTVRDAISDLPDPKQNRGELEILNHEFRAGARVYVGHTGSPLDEPAKALKAGDHGVPGGENMLVFPNRKVRYFTIRESARLQCFPDNYFFPVSWTESMRQLGNAVPVTLGRVVTESIAKTLRASNDRTSTYSPTAVGG